MTPVEIAASSPSLSAVATSFTVFVVAVAAVVGGVYKGIKDIRKGSASTEAKTAILLDPSSARDVTESMRMLTQSNAELRDAMKLAARRTEDVVEALEDHRKITRSHIEEQHRLRAATVDLIDQMRRQT